MTIKKIDVRQLQPGMFVINFNTQWEKHPFYLRRLHIDSEEQIRLVAGSGIQEVLIDTSRGSDVAADATAQPSVRRSSGAKEFRQARQLIEQASVVVRRAFNDIRLGQKVDMEAVQRVAIETAESVIRDRNLMMLVCGMYQQRPSVFVHSVNVCVLLINFAYQQELSGDKIRALALGGLLHDLGLGASAVDPITGEPVDDHAHVAKTLTQLAPYNLPPETLAVIGEHHERADGSGYPRGLTSGEISLYGTMAGIADAYDQLCSLKLCSPSYGEGVLPPTEAMAKLFEWGPRYFDSMLGAGFVRAIGIYPVGSLVQLSSGLLAVVMDHRPDALLHPRVRVIYDTALPGPVRVEDRDLAEEPWLTQDRIVAPEDPAKWGILIEDYLGLNPQQ